MDNSEDGALEFAITRRALSTYLPVKGRILDLGGGPGRYAIWLAQPSFVARLMEEGVFLNDVPSRFTNGPGVCRQEVAPFFDTHGFETLAPLAAETIVPDIQGVLFELEQADLVTYETAFDLIWRAAGDLCILGMASHLLYVGRLSP